VPTPEGNAPVEPVAEGRTRGRRTVVWSSGPELVQRCRVDARRGELRVEQHGRGLGVDDLRRVVVGAHLDEQADDALVDYSGPPTPSACSC
jgi:hypothetical protein